jgi:hypothetical protein
VASVSLIGLDAALTARDDIEQLDAAAVGSADGGGRDGQDRVIAGAGKADLRGAHPGENEPVGGASQGPAFVDDVIAVAARPDIGVIAVAADQQVIAGAAAQAVVSAQARQNIGPRRTGNRIRAVEAGNPVIAGGGGGRDDLGPDLIGAPCGVGEPDRLDAALPSGLILISLTLPPSVPPTLEGAMIKVTSLPERAKLTCAALTPVRTSLSAEPPKLPAFVDDVIAVAARPDIGVIAVAADQQVIASAAAQAVVSERPTECRLAPGSYPKPRSR